MRTFALHLSRVSNGDGFFLQVEEVMDPVLAGRDGEASNYWLSRSEPLCYRATHNHLDEELPRWRCATSFQ
jgi:hypothetical protein